MHASKIGSILLLHALLASPAPALAISVGTMWAAASRLTPPEATEVLLREAEGEAVSPDELFEAEKYLRTNGGVSLGAHVVTDVLDRFLSRRLHAFSGDLHVRTLPPVLHWLDASVARDRLRIRGERVQIAVVNARRASAMTVVHHRTIHQDWYLDDGALRVTPVTNAVRSRVGYRLSTERGAVAAANALDSDLVFASEIAGWLSSSRRPRNVGATSTTCDPEPIDVSAATDSTTVTFDHAVESTVEGSANQILCSFRRTAERSPARVRFGYWVDGQLATAPSSAARSAARNNPIAFDLFEPDHAAYG